jgi:hypothetical protein
MRLNRACTVSARAFTGACFGKSGNTFDEDVAFGEQAHEQSFDKLLLTDQNLADFAAHAIDKTMLLFDPPGEFFHDTFSPMVATVKDSLSRKPRGPHPLQ